MSEPVPNFDAAVPFLLMLPLTLRLRKRKLEADQSNLAKTPENVRSHVALRAKIQELDFWLQILSSDVSLKDLMAWGPEEEASSPAPAAEPSSLAPATESHWPYPKTYEELRAQLLVAADEDTTYEIGAAELLLLLDEGQRESTEAHARLAALLGVDVKDVGLGDLVDMVRPQVVADKDWYKEHYQVEVSDG